MKHSELLYMFSMFENIALIAGVTYAATTFGNWKLLWFLLLVLFNAPTIKWKDRSHAEETEAEK